MNRGRPVLADARRVTRRDVADMGREPVLREERIEAAHDAIADDLGHDRGGGDGGAAAVAADDGEVLGRLLAEAEAVDEADLGGRRERVQDSRRLARFDACSPTRSISACVTTRIEMRSAQATTARNSSSRRAMSSSFESLRYASGRTR